MSNSIVEDMDNLRHMLGIDLSQPKKTWGYRNFFDAGDSDLPSMERLVELGLAKRANTKASLFSATADGRAAVGLTEAQYRSHR